ncbi:MAG: MFS transporter [Anaerolineales bacterium]|nr:MFS transporter [Anaerolineales bacterium]
METSQTSKRHWLAGHLPFFYGWMIVPISVVTLLATSPGQTFLVSVFNPYFRETFNLSLSQLSAAYMGGTLLAAIPQPFLGTLMHKWGIRRLTLISLLMLGLTCLFTSQARNLFMLFLAFFFLRTFGQGALTLLSSNMLAMWFRTRLGTVSGITGVLNYVFVGVEPVGCLGRFFEVAAGDEDVPVC